MPEVWAAIFDRIFSDPKLRAALEEACRSGRIRAMGKRVKHILNERAKGRFTARESVEPRLESIPPDDFADLSLFRLGNELRLAGTEKWVNGDQLYRPKAWVSVCFSERDLLDLAKLLPAHEPSAHVQGLDGEALSGEIEPKPSTARHLTNKIALSLTNEYIDSVKSRDRDPTSSGLERYVREKGYRGNRNFLRASFKEILGPKFKGRGRPQKNSPK
jgi:hypothetical protein